MLAKLRDGGELEEEDEGYCNSSEDDAEITDEIAARGVGEAGAIRVAQSLGDRLDPVNLLSAYCNAGHASVGGHRAGR